MRAKLRSGPAVLAILCTISLTTIVSQPISAQIPGRNVNMVSGVEWPTGDPFLQRQNEPSVAVSTRNPMHLLAGANDYRTMDLPGLPDGVVTGDAWLGVSILRRGRDVAEHAASASPPSIRYQRLRSPRGRR